MYIDLLTLIDRYKLYFSLEAFKSFQLQFEQLLLTHGKKGKRYLPCFYCFQKSKKAESVFTFAVQKSDSKKLKPFSVYVGFLKTDDVTGKNRFYIGSSEPGALPRINEKKMSTQEFLMVFHKKQEAPIWESEKRLEIALQALVAHARFELGETKILNFNSIPRSKEKGFATVLTKTEITQICLGVPECYQNFDVMSIRELQNLNNTIKKK